MKRLLAFALPLALAPTSALAEPFSPSWTETFVLPSRRSETNASLWAQQDFYVGNFTGVTLFTEGTLTPPFPTTVTAGNYGWASVLTWIPGGHTYTYSTDLGNRTGNAKTCSWQLVVTLDSNRVCSGVLQQAAAGTQGVQCAIDSAQSFIDPVTCQSQVVTYIQ
ncbi:hypothetical protein ACN47A_17080 [Myxococcus fulvus]|uniref:hypothetical protein n=1 Tax=Myxococcus fulvus TaxID=33 RepID=UPI003B996ADB